MEKSLLDPAIVAHGLSVMATEMLFLDLPDRLTRLLGERQAALILAGSAASAAERGFRAFMEKAGLWPEDPMRVVELLLLSRGGERLHPFQVVERVEKRGEEYILVLTRQQSWGMARAAILAGVVAGMITAMGRRARPLPSRPGQRGTLREMGVELVVYPEEASGAWMVVVEAV